MLFALSKWWILPPSLCSGVIRTYCFCFVYTLAKTMCSLKGVNILKQKYPHGREVALKIAELVAEKKAKKITILDISGQSSLFNYFVICSGESPRQVEAIYRDILAYCRQNNIKVHRGEPDEAGNWAIVDFFDVMLHIFSEEAREFYNLEYLWNDAKKVKLNKAILKHSSDNVVQDS